MYNTGKNQRFFDFAVRMAKLSKYGKFQHGAVLVKHGSVMSAGHNKDRPTAFGSRFRHPDTGQATVHAELCAILNVPRCTTEKSDVYVVRLGLKGDLRNSRPCPMCQEAMRFVGVKRVFFTTEGGGFDCMKL